MNLKRARIHIRGIVQGVGFRPYVHRFVRELDLRGTIKNTSSGALYATLLRTHMPSASETVGARSNGLVLTTGFPHPGH